MLARQRSRPFGADSTNDRHRFITEMNHRDAGVTDVRPE
jgi:hypothetical protein